MYPSTLNGGFASAWTFATRGVLFKQRFDERLAEYGLSFSRKQALLLIEMAMAIYTGDGYLLFDNNFFSNISWFDYDLDVLFSLVEGKFVKEFGEQKWILTKEGYSAANTCYFQLMSAFDDVKSEDVSSYFLGDSE